MKHLLMCLCTTLMWAANSACAGLFLLGDDTPIFALNDHLLPAVEGNQQLFLRFAKAHSKESPKVLWRYGDRISEGAAGELDTFYQGNNIDAQRTQSLSAHTLEGVDLLILGLPDWAWEADDLSGIADLLGRGGNVVLIVEPNNYCDAKCEETTAALLRSLGSSLRIGPEVDCCGVRGVVGKPTGEPFMQGIGPVEYGSTHTVLGGKALLLHGGGLSMLSVDDKDFRLPATCDAASC